MFEEIIAFIRTLYGSNGSIALHEPMFQGNERKYVMETIDSTFVSSVGAFVPRFESQLAATLGVPENRVVAVVNGTNALQVALRLSGVNAGDLVLTQSLTFVATCNAIRYLGADPVFVDVDLETLSLSPLSLKSFIGSHCEIREKSLYHRDSGRKISACLPMHTLGHPARLNEILNVCRENYIPLVEDAAESLGSQYRNTPTGTIGDFGVFSFNGNKIVTTGGGGAVVAASEVAAKKARHLTTTAKIPHPWEFKHDDLGYNFRMPNLNAALGCGQLERLDEFVQRKRNVALSYSSFFESLRGEFRFFSEPSESKSNYWLNAFRVQNRAERDKFLQFSSEKGVQCRPLWNLMSTLPMYEDCLKDSLENSKLISDTFINIPSSAIEIRK